MLGDGIRSEQPLSRACPSFELSEDILLCFQECFSEEAHWHHCSISSQPPEHYTPLLLFFLTLLFLFCEGGGRRAGDVVMAMKVQTTPEAP